MAATADSLKAWLIIGDVVYRIYKYWSGEKMAAAVDSMKAWLIIL